VKRAGAKCDSIDQYYASDGTEAFHEGALLLDRELDLLDAKGARILVVFSDAFFVSTTDESYAWTFMQLCKSKGVAVIWANTQEIHTDYGHGTKLERLPRDPMKMVEILGKAILAEVRKVQGAAA
jgi:hypothetical protein